MSRDALARRAALLAALALAGCADEDPCADAAEPCIVVRVTSQAINRLDQLELDVLFGDRHGTTTTPAEGPQRVALPVITGIELEDPLTEPLAVSVVAAAKLDGAVVGTGAAAIELAPGTRRASISIELAPPEDCVAESLYCGGNKLAGDPQTLYQCKRDGVPRARGTCAGGCLERPGNNDTCRGIGGPCTEGTNYCGGNELDGDPQTLYRCTGGVGAKVMTCANGCLQRPEMQDICR